MTTSIEIKGLKLQAFHGVLPQEHIVGNLYTVDLIIFTDFSNAMESDSLDDTINYGEAVGIIKDEMKIESQLLEHVAGRIIRHLQERWDSKISGIDLRIAKQTPPITNADIENCAVHITI